MSNANLHSAKRRRNDEFYTRLSDIQTELDHYDSYLTGSSVYLPCDDDGSKFWTYFIDNFNRLSLSHLTATRYVPNGQAFRLDTSDGATVHVSPLAGDGDFLSDENKAIMTEADVVITNPPFSLMREFITTLMEMEKGFITLAPMNAITYKCIFPHIKHGRIRLGHAGIKAMKFDTPDGSEKSIPVIWLTSYPIIRECQKLELTQTYDPERYPTYDNYDAIEVSRCKDIPVDYDGVMGVPITFLSYWQPGEYSLIGHVHDLSGDGADGIDAGQFEIDGRGVYMRLLVEKPHIAYDVIGLDRYEAPKSCLRGGGGSQLMDDRGTPASSFELIGHEHDVTGDGGCGVTHRQFEIVEREREREKGRV